MKEQKNALEFFGFLLVMAASVAFLSAGTAMAEQGGLPACMDDLNTCKEELATCESSATQTGTNSPDSRFTVNFNTYEEEDGTVTDNLTGLVWMKNAKLSEPVDWDTALDVCNNLQDDGINLADGSLPGDWRLPDIKELQGLIDYGQLGPAIPLNHPFVDVQSEIYWSSTTYAGSDSYAWYVSLNSGNDYILFKNGDWGNGYVWCVRDGQY